MLSAIFTFLGGSVFRMLWGEISHWITEQQNHKNEIERMRLQADLDARQFDRNQAAIKLQAELGVKTIQVQAESAIGQVEVDAWSKVVESTTKLTGIKWLDGWNGSIRPLLATLAILCVVGEVVAHGFQLNDWNREIIALILGIYLADRQLAKRGK